MRNVVKAKQQFQEKACADHQADNQDGRGRLMHDSVCLCPIPGTDEAVEKQVNEAMEALEREVEDSSSTERERWNDLNWRLVVLGGA